MSAPKPAIAPEAQERILAFVNAIESLQVTYGIEIAASDNAIVFRDMKRTDEWIDSSGESYGDWDAFIFNADDYLNPSDLGSFRAENIEFEDFESWDK